MAILTDPEATANDEGGADQASDGHLQEPALFISGIVRAFGGTMNDQNYWQSELSSLGQDLFDSPSVFNYYSPSYGISGTPLKGPEFQIHSPNNAIVRANLGALSQAKAIVGKSSEIGALPNARRLIVDGASMVGGVFGFTGILLLMFNRDWWRKHARQRVLLIVLGVPAAVVLLQFTWLAGGKSGEFGRFAVLPDVVLMMIGVVMVASLRLGREWPAAMMASLVLLVGFQGLSYWVGFIEDARGAATSTRIAVARRLAELKGRGAKTIAVAAEPAPYCLPAVDLTGWRMELLPADGETPEGEDAPDVIVRAVDELGRGGDEAGTPYARIYYGGAWPWVKTRISWADKPFELLIRRDLIGDHKP